MEDIPKIAGGMNAYEFYVEVCLRFLCDDCGADLECPVLNSDESAPNPPWSTREGKRGMALGWYVPPLLPDGSMRLLSLCPACAQKRGLSVPI
jgi:hypothetical protein